MLRTFGVIGGRFGTSELNRVNTVEIADLVALSFQPDILYAWNLGGEGFETGEGFIFVIL